MGTEKAVNLVTDSVLPVLEVHYLITMTTLIGGKFEFS